MNESKCKACDAELVYVGSLFKGGALKCLKCDSKNAHGNSGLGGSYAAQDDGVACEYCGTHHKIWESCPE